MSKTPSVNYFGPVMWREDGLGRLPAYSVGTMRHRREDGVNSVGQERHVIGGRKEQAPIGHIFLACVK